MRVTPSAVSAQLQRELSTAMAAIARQQQHISAARRILAPSDDPGGAARAVTIRSRRAALAQFQENVASARGTLSATDSTLSSISEVITEASEAAVQGASDNTDALGRQGIGAKVDQLLESLVALANSRGATGTFLFGGQESTTAPYSATRDAAGQIIAVTPNPRGIDAATSAEVGDGVTVATTVSGTSVFGAAATSAYAFDVLIELRDALVAQPQLSFTADVGGSGTLAANRYAGIATAADLQIGGPRGTVFVGATASGTDTSSYSGNASSAIATAAAINLATPSTGVTATATKAEVAYAAGSFAQDVTLDGTAGKRLVINGTSLTGAVAGATASDRRDALVALINTGSGTTGVTASAIPGGNGFSLTAADGRNISIETDGTLGPSSANAMFFGFTTGLTATGAATAVVARGGVKLSANGAVTVTPSTASPLGSQMNGQGTTGIQSALGDLNTMLDRVVGPVTLVGARLAWTSLLDDRMTAEATGLATDLAHIEDLDVAAASTELQQLETFYQGALASGARMIQLSLLDFLQ